MFCLQLVRRAISTRLRRPPDAVFWRRRAQPEQEHPANHTGKTV